MPFINVKLIEGVSPGKKAELIEKMTQLMVDVLGKNPATTVVVIEELPSDNWGIGGRTVTERMSQAG